MLNPSTGQGFAEIADGDASDLDAAVLAARRAFDEGPWSQMAAVERSRIRLRLPDKIAANADELSRLEGQDTGKPIAQPRADIAATVPYSEFYGAAADKLMGKTISALSSGAPAFRARQRWKRQRPIAGNSRYQ